MKGMTLFYFSILIFAIVAIRSQARARDYPLTPVPFNAVHIKDGFWGPRMETNRKVTIPFDFKKCEETGRIDNFAKAGGLMPGQFVGIRYNDSDVYKVIEGAAYSLSIHPDPELEKYLDDLIAKIAAAQEDDGYLYTTRTIDPEHPARAAGKTRWSYLQHSHELYNVGHMYEAAVAYYQATGKRSLLDVAIKNANLIASVFGPDGKHAVPGHEEIEIGLAKLYRVTGDEKYLKLAKFFLDQRGRPEGRELYGEYCQDHKPVIEQTEAVGHAVRAGYLYCGMADIAALTGDQSYVKAIDRIWENVVSKKLYITGGIGARRKGEAFGDNYELPNKDAYNETCAAVANALWNYRMFLLHGNAKYIDVLERIIYNGFLSGVSLDGKEFFYPNPLASAGNYSRSPWFDCSCCPTNVVRFLPSLPGYAYATKNDRLYINLFLSGRADVDMKNSSVTIEQKTQYPWSGDIHISIEPKKNARFAIYLRIPGWAQNHPVPGDLYRYVKKIEGNIVLKINGKPMPISTKDGYAVIERTWQKGDRIDLHLPMPVRRVLANEKVEADRGLVAIERGPIVYCAEEVDNGVNVFSLKLPDTSELTPEHRSQLLGGVTVLRGAALVEKEVEGKSIDETTTLTLIPYYAWAHRGKGTMTVWLKRMIAR